LTRLSGQICVLLSPQTPEVGTPRAEETTHKKTHETKKDHTKALSMLSRSSSCSSGRQFFGLESVVGHRLAWARSTQQQRLYKHPSWFIKNGSSRCCLLDYRQSFFSSISTSHYRHDNHQLNGSNSTLTLDKGEEHESTTSTAAAAAASPRVSLLEGVVLDHAINLQTVRPGDQIHLPYELTISESLQDFWFASFFDQSRIHCSTPFCRSMGLQDRVLPFSLALFLTSSMSHADAAKVQVGFGNVHYLWPLFAGDTVRKSFTVQRIRNTSDGNHSVIHFDCALVNQRGRICMHADKRMLFQFAATPESNTSTVGSLAASHTTSNQQRQQLADVHLFRDHLLSKATTVLAEQPSHSLAHLAPGQLILHTMHRSLPFSSSQQLASLARLTHERHFDIRLYERTSEILVPGGLVLGIALQASARDLHEVLHEEITSCAYCQPLNPDTMVGAVSYVHAVDDNLPGDLELVTVTTLGIKNLNVKRDLTGVGLPKTLFQAGIHAKEVEQICKESCPTLSHKIVVQVQRKILRQAPHREVFLL